MRTMKIMEVMILMIRLMLMKFKIWESRTIEFAFEFEFKLDFELDFELKIELDMS